MDLSHRTNLTVPRWLDVAGRTLTMLGIASVLYLAVYRPLQLRWGATKDETSRALPGDSIQARPAFNATRAVTIEAPPAEVWPWLVQIGYHRAGWYSVLDWADNSSVPSATRVVPHLQRLEVGDSIPITGKGDPFSFVPAIDFTVVDLVPNRHILATSPSGQDSWLWLLEPAPGGRTRLIWRMRSAPYAWSSAFIGLQLATDLGDFIFVRNILLSIKERVESKPLVSLAASTPMVLSWLLAFATFLCTLAIIVVRRDWVRPLLAIAASGGVTLALVFGMPPLWVNAASVMTLVGAVWAIYRWRPRGTVTLPTQAAEIMRPLRHQDPARGS